MSARVLVSERAPTQPGSSMSLSMQSGSADSASGDSVRLYSCAMHVWGGTAYAHSFVWYDYYDIHTVRIPQGSAHRIQLTKCTFARRLTKRAHASSHLRSGKTSLWLKRLLRPGFDVIRVSICTRATTCCVCERAGEGTPGSVRSRREAISDCETRAQSRTLAQPALAWSSYPARMTTCTGGVGFGFMDALQALCRW
jgi:hypothetical protein